MKRNKVRTSERRIWPRDWTVGLNTWIERKGQVVLHEQVADLLSALDRTRSISAAARVQHISYRHAWLMLKEANENAGQPLFETAVGGKRGGGAELTDYGRTALDVFQRMSQDVRAAAARALPKILAATSQETSTVHLAAAISLQDVVALVLNEYALVRPTVKVRTVFGASNELADQIIAGQTTDVFLSANRGYINQLVKAKLLDADSRCTLATNGLAVVGEPGLKGLLRTLADLRRISDCQVVVADPACPLGKCTTQVLKSSGLYDELRSRFRVVDNSRAVVSSTRSRSGSVGIVFGSDAASVSGLRTLLLVPTSEIKTTYEGAVASSSLAADEARQLLSYLKSNASQSWFRRCGFIV